MEKFLIIPDLCDIETSLSIAGKYGFGFEYNDFYIPDILDDTCSRKFRSRSDVNQYLFRYWQLCEGKFKVRRPMSTYLTIGQDSSDKIKSTLNSKKFKVVCVNDDPMGFDFIEEQEKLVAVFEGLFPEKSPFEKS